MLGNMFKVDPKERMDMNQIMGNIHILFIIIK